jgi:lipoyl(octanoyl) transferase
MNRQMLVRKLGLSDYRETWAEMQKFTDRRDAGTPDEFWLTEHQAVFTQGLNGRAEHLLAPGDIPVVQTDRGGQVTYHGPGQLVVYCLLDIQRLGLGVKGLVGRIEQSVIDLLAGYGIEATTRRAAPGVYVGEAKIAALGLRIRKGCCYHGLSLNVDPDLEPFSRINPCGFKDLAVTRLSDLGVSDDLQTVGESLATMLTEGLSEKKPGSTGR